MKPCRIWWAAPVTPEDAPGLVAELDEHERARLDRFHRAVDRARYLASHALVRRVLAAELGRPAVSIELDRTCRCGQQHGKPRTPGGPEFSSTHAGDLVGVAVHTAPVGLDVEQIRPMSDLAAMAEHVLSPAEATRPDDLTVDDFFRMWSRKEALLKSTGWGLSSPMSGIRLDGTRVVGWTGPGAADGPVWLVDLRPASDHPAAVAGLGPASPPVVEADGDALLRGR